MYELTTDMRELMHHDLMRLDLQRNIHLMRQQNEGYILTHDIARLTVCIDGITIQQYKSHI